MQGVMDDTDKEILKAIREGRNTSKMLIHYLAGLGIEVSQPTMSRRLTALVDGRHVRIVGKGRATQYEYDDFADYFNVPAERRRPVGYNGALIENYSPNKTRWFPPETLTNLFEAGGGRKLEASTYSRAISQKLLVDLSYASSSLEGNTYSYLDTQVLIEYGQAADGKAADETQMILNHKEAIVYLIDNLDEIQVDKREVLTMHALLSRGLIEQQDVGAVRRRIVSIGNSAYTPMAIPQRLEEEMEKITAKAALIEDPFEQSIFLMTTISYLQYFIDVNKRTGRLMANVPLLKAGLAPLSFMSVDKAKYARGLLAFYELGRHDLIVEAFAEGYIESAHRYDAYLGRDRKEVEIEYRRRGDLYGAVKNYVLQSLEAGYRLDPAAHFAASFADDAEEIKEALVSRGIDIVENLHEGNNVAYGIKRKEFDEYTNLGPAETKPSSDENEVSPGDEFTM
jgi:Fic family protein